MTSAYRDGPNMVTLLRQCRELRQNETDAEHLLWRLLRGRQLANAKFRRQHQFGPYILDFFCAEHSLAIEVDGGQHFDESKAAGDAERTRYLGERGVRVVRFTNLQVLQETEAVVEMIWRAVERLSHSPPSP